MSYADNLLVFWALLFGILVVPGMDMLFTLTNALTGGRRAGLAAVSGIMIGGALHTLVATLGVGIILKLAPQLFTLMLMAGSVYMAWIGIALMRSAIVIEGVPGTAKRSLVVICRQGLITCMLNPKAYLFTFSTYPQFMKPVYGPLWSQALVLGVMAVFMQFAVYGSLALAAGQVKEFLLASPGTTIWVGRCAGVLFILIALWTAWHGWTALK